PLARLLLSMRSYDHQHLESEHRVSHLFLSLHIFLSIFKKSGGLVRNSTIWFNHELSHCLAPLLHIIPNHYFSSSSKSTSKCSKGICYVFTFSFNRTFTSFNSSMNASFSSFFLKGNATG